MHRLAVLPLLFMACPADKPDTAGPDTTPPQVTLIRPLPGETVSGVLEIRVGAEDPGGVENVEFRVYDDVLGLDATAPYAQTWDTAMSLNGTWRIVAIARDAAGNEGRDELEVVVDNPNGAAPDSVEVVSPLDGTTVCGTVRVTAVSSSAVSFSLDGSKTAVDEAEPYTWDWDTTTTANGPHRIIATVTDAEGGSARARIDVEVANTSALCDLLPSVEFLSPEPGAMFGGDLSIEAEARDNNSILGVRFQVDDTVLSEDLEAPYTALWSTSIYPEGQYILRAIATDDAGQQAVAGLTVTVDRVPPEVELVAPLDGSTLEGETTLTAIATDTLGLGPATFYVGDTVVGVVEAEPYTLTWDSENVEDGTWDLKVVVADVAGNTAEDAISVEIDNPAHVLYTSPTDGATVSGTVTVAAEITGGDASSYTSMKFYLDGSRVTTDNGAPFTYSWDTCDETRGTYELSAQSTDRTGYTATGDITVEVNQPLEVYLESPTGTLSNPATLLALVSDDDAISSVTFDLDGTVIATVESPTGRPTSCSATCDCDMYTESWDTTGVTSGAHTLTVTVTNLAGEVATAIGAVTAP